LARVIDDLEKDHPEIQSEWEASNGKRYKRYWLPKGQLEMFQAVPPAMPAQSRGATGPAPLERDRLAAFQAT
jgi:hypothetical protein